MTQDRRHMLEGPVRFALFATSYTPLFSLIVLRQLTENAELLHWGGFSGAALQLFARNFLTSVILGGVSVVGAVILWIAIGNIARSARSNGTPVQILEVRNRNSESISYIGTYIIPFLFEDYSSFFSVVAIAILLIVIYFIYVRSTLLLINPLLNLWFTLYEVEFSDAPGLDGLRTRHKNGMIISRHKFLEEGDTALFQKIGPKLYFAEPHAQAA